MLSNQTKATNRADRRLRTDPMQRQYQRPIEAEQFIGQSLRASWQARQIDQQALAKRLILSVRQLNALAVADPSAFHTYGIYLRALRFAAQEARLLENPQVHEQLELLVEHYSRDPHSSSIDKVKQTVNRKLGVAPRQPDTEKQVDTRGVVALLLIVAVVVVLSAYVGLAT